MKKAFIILATVFTLILIPNIEIDKGICRDGAGNGKIIDSTYGVVLPYNYISYKGIAKERETVYTMTVFDLRWPNEDNFLLVMDYNKNTKQLSIR